MHASVTQKKSAQDSPLSRQKKICFSMAAILFSLIVIIAALEIVLRVLYREEEVSYFGLHAFIRDEAVGLRHAPGYEGSGYRKGVFEFPVKIRPNGLRQANFDAQAQYPTKLLLLGDSFTFGMGHPEEAIFATLIQPALNFEGIGVINGGQSGYCVTQEALWGMRLAQEIEPKIIVVALFAGNDVKGDYYKDYKNVEVRYGYRFWKDRWLPIAPLDYLRARSYAWMLLDIRMQRSRIKALGAAFQQLVKDSLAQAIQPTVQAFRMLDEYCSQNGIVLGVMMIPQFGKKSIFDDSLKRFFKKEGIPVLDLSEKKIRRADYFASDAHWNEKGHKKAAKYLTRFCVRLFKSRKDE